MSRKPIPLQTFHFPSSIALGQGKAGTDSPALVKGACKFSGGCRQEQDRTRLFQSYGRVVAVFGVSPWVRATQISILVIFR